MANIFIVEDDILLREELTHLLTSYGHKCIHTDDFQHIVPKILEAHCDLVLLDIQLPYYDGYYICREVRAKSNVPIIVVTSRNTDMDELISMNLGADDFITKPYHTQVLLAHINAVLKRTMHATPLQVLSHKEVMLSLGSGIVSYKDKQVELTKNEQRILTLLMRHKGSIVSRDEIMNELWQSDEFIDDNTLTVNVNRLRKRLEELGVYDYLITKRGQGYMV
ncbi:MAG: response regulator transcription factor [Zhenhengia sp.]|uniref:response regulator transcription factor n=1 Tax=Zhenhengia sp. TaxID=2944208 RepID=UPI00290F64EB|nr:response regulator transcription factor [Clostridiales bacterium]MDU6974494.1 response regulator transcription factor [Clostridiales bacterium]